MRKMLRSDLTNEEELMPFPTPFTHELLLL